MLFPYRSLFLKYWAVFVRLNKRILPPRIGVFDKKKISDYLRNVKANERYMYINIAYSVLIKQMSLLSSLPLRAIWCNCFVLYFIYLFIFDPVIWFEAQENLQVEGCRLKSFAVFVKSKTHSGLFTSASIVKHFNLPKKKSKSVRKIKNPKHVHAESRCWIFKALLA